MKSEEDISWKTIFCEDERALPMLRSIFRDGKANEMNLCLFSTSGIHGNYCTIEQVEALVLAGESEDEIPELTFLVVRPRVVCLQYGNCNPRTPEEFAFLKRLRQSSWEAFAKIGK